MTCGEQWTREIRDLGILARRFKLRVFRENAYGIFCWRNLQNSLYKHMGARKKMVRGTKKTLFWCRRICSKYTTKKKLIVPKTLIEDVSSYCSEIKRFCSRKKLVVHKRSRIVIRWSWMYLFDLRIAFRFLPKERRDQRSKTYVHFRICTKLNDVRIHYAVL